MRDVQVRPSRPDDARIVALLGELDAHLYERYPVEEFGTGINHILGVQALLDPSVTFVAAWDGDEPVGCGAVRRMDDAAGAYGEVKRMFVRPAARGRRIAQDILRTLEDTLRAEGIARALLETGMRQHEARRLYERCGWQVRGPFGDYPEHPVSVFMEKRL